MKRCGWIPASSAAPLGRPLALLAAFSCKCNFFATQLRSSQQCSVDDADYCGPDGARLPLQMLGGHNDSRAAAAGIQPQGRTASCGPADFFGAEFIRPCAASCRAKRAQQSNRRHIYVKAVTTRALITASHLFSLPSGQSVINLPRIKMAAASNKNAGIGASIRNAVRERPFSSVLGECGRYFCMQYCKTWAPRAKAEQVTGPRDSALPCVKQHVQRCILPAGGAE